LLACDWLLTTRTELWEYEMSNGISSSNTSVSGFKHDLNALQKLTSYVPGK